MTIGLGTAIGLGGKLESENSGVAEIIRQTGEGISGSIRQGGAGVSAGLKTLDDEKKLRAKDVPDAIPTDLMAGEKQRLEYGQAAAQSIAKVNDAYNKYINREMSKGAYEQLQANEVSRLKNMKMDMEADYKVLTEELPKIDPDLYDISEVKNALIGKRIVRQKEIKQGEGESAKDQIGTDVETIPGYFDLPYDKQRELYKGGLKQLAGKSRPIGATFSEGWKDAFGSDSLDSFIVEKNVEGPTGLKTQSFEIKAEDAKNAFNQMMGMRGTNLSPKLNKYFRTLEVQAARVADDMNLQGEQREFFIETQIERLAAEDFQNRLNESVRNRTKDLKADNNPENEGKGLNITFGAGGAMSSGNTNVKEIVGEPAERTSKIDQEISSYESQIEKINREMEEAKQSGNTLQVKVFEKKKEILEGEIKTLQNMPKDVDRYWLLSAQGNVDEGKLTFTEGKNPVYMSPTSFYQTKDGKWKIGGLVEEKTKGDEKVKKFKEIEMDDNNYGVLTINKKGFETIFNEITKEMGKESKPTKNKEQYPTIKTKAEFDKLKKGEGFYNSKSEYKVKG